jgi:hypothetical protein
METWLDVGRKQLLVEPMVKPLFLAFSICLAFCVEASAAGPLFDDHSLISMQLVGDFSNLLKEKDKEKSYPAKLIYSTETGSNEVSVKLQVRGNARLEHCKVPGLRVIFPKSGVDGLFSDQRKLKLVTQCRQRSDKYEQYLLQEYLIYRMHEQLTEYSFKSRLVRVEFQDSGKKSQEWNNFAFFIEDNKRMAARLGATVIEKPRVQRSQLAPRETNLVSVFQYMIGNTDYSMLKGEGEEDCCHNLRLLYKGEGYIPVPYDFDFAGLINASYAAPADGLGIRKVTQRVYRGFCGGNDQLTENLSLVQANKSMLYEIIDDGELKDRTVKNMHRYLDGFYEIIDDPKKLDKKIVQRCRAKPQPKK